MGKDEFCKRSNFQTDNKHNCIGRLTAAGKYAFKWEKGHVFMLMIPHKEN